MLYTIKEDLELCKQFKLSTIQLAFLKIMVGDPSKVEGEQIKERKKLALKFQTVFKKCNITLNEVADLIARNIIEDYNAPGDVFFDAYELSGVWANKLRLAVYPMPQELFDAYPINIEVQHKLYMGRNIAPEEFAQKYLNAIGKDPEEHKKVLDDIAWAIENNNLSVGLKKFVDSTYWLHLRELRKKNLTQGGFSDIQIG